MKATALLPAARLRVHPEVYHWLEPEIIDRNLLAELEPEVNRIGDDELADGFRRLCPVAGASAASYQPRLLEVPDVASPLTVLAGIRFEGLDPAKPFVGVSWQSRLLRDAEELRLLADAMQLAFAVFAPPRVQVYWPAHVALPASAADAGVEIAADLRLLAAPVRQLLATDLPPGAARVRLEPATNLSFYPRYQEIYRQLHLERPWLAAVADAESEETLEGCREQGGLFEVIVDDSWAGVLALHHEVMCGVGGWYVAEIVLAKAFRGAGLGVAVQRALAQRLAADPAGGEEAIVFGTIGAHNEPALRTARRAGRVELGAAYWLS